MPSVVSTGRTVTRELLEAMRRTHPLEHAMATLLIQEGSWKIAGNDDKNSDSDSRKVSAKTYLCDTARNCNELYAGEIY